MSEALPDPDAAPWWEGVAQGELRFQRCRSCGKAVFYPRSVCPHCFAATLDWQVSRGRGQVYAFTVVHRAPGRKFADRTPYVVALVDLDEGFRMLTNIVDCEPDAVRIGMAVELTFGEDGEGQRLPYFRPADGTGLRRSGSG